MSEPSVPSQRPACSPSAPDGSPSSPSSENSSPPVPASFSVPPTSVGPLSSRRFPPSQCTHTGYLPPPCLPTPAPGGVCCVAPWASSYRSVPGVLGPPGSGVLSSCVRPTSGGELSAAAAEEAELKPTACRKKIRSLRDLSSWTASHSHKEYIRFLKRLSGAVSDRKAVCRAPQLPAGGVQASDGAAHDNAPCARTPENRARALAARLAGEPGNEDLHPVSDSVIGVLKLLLQLSDWIDEVPPVEQPMRFGNRAFRTWHQRMKERCHDLLGSIIPQNPAPPPPPRSCPVSFEAIPEEEADTGPQQADSEGASLDASPRKGGAQSESRVGGPTESSSGAKRKEPASPPMSAPHSPVGAESEDPGKLATRKAGRDSPREELLSELHDYCCHAFGDSKRLDYGTGHEVSFGIFLFVLFEAGVLQSPADDAAAVLLIFTQYVELCHKLQTTYSLEPAGSRGAWGLDDFHFLPFLFGSAQLVNNHFIQPAQITDTMIVHEMAPTNLYFFSIEYVTQTKKGAPFSECAPMLYDISGVSTWRKIHNGLIKMYECEVLAKFPIAQHFLFGSYFPLFLDEDASQMKNTPAFLSKTQQS